MPTPYPLAGLAIAVAGADKLVGQRGYRRFYGEIGLPEREMQRIGAAEALGGLLMIAKPTRRLGAAIVVAASARVLAHELSQGRTAAAGSRAALLLSAAAALVLPG